MITFLIFLAVIAVLVLSHEFGHFIFAKVRGVRVDEFGFGFPPRIFGMKFGETLYSINLLPFGGFVKIYGEDTTEAASDPRNFASRSFSDRFWIIFAGVLMNMLLAYLLFTFGHILGLPSVVDESNAAYAKDAVVRIVEVVPGSPAETSGIKLGDAIRSVAYGTETLDVQNIQQVQDFIKSHTGRQILLTLEREQEELILAVTPRENPAPGEGAVGIAMLKTGIVKTPIWKAPWEGLKTTYYATRGVGEGLALFFGNLFRGIFMEEVSGPVGIAQAAGQAGRLGFIYLLHLTALMSVNLALLNLLPIPALDGGRIFFLLIEKIRGTPLNIRVTQMVHAVGFVALIALMLLITYRDIAKLL